MITNDLDGASLEDSSFIDGDLDGDGRDDILLGVPYDDTTASSAGAVYIFNGGDWVYGAQDGR